VRPKVPACADILQSGAASTKPATSAAGPRSALGQFGGHSGRALRAGRCAAAVSRMREGNVPAGREPLPALSNHWTIGVSYGPHGAPDFFTDDDITQFFATAWEVPLQLVAHGRPPDRTQARVGACGRWRGRAPSPRTSTTTPTRSARLISLATCRSSSGPTARASADSCARPQSCNRNSGKSGRLRPGDKITFHPIALENPRPHLQAPPPSPAFPQRWSPSSATVRRSGLPSAGGQWNSCGIRRHGPRSTSSFSCAGTLRSPGG